MKEVLSFLTFCIGTFCFAVFVTVFKPAAVSAIPGPSKPEYCSMGSSPTHRCTPHVFAAVSWAEFGQR